MSRPYLQRYRLQNFAGELGLAAGTVSLEVPQFESILRVAVTCHLRLSWHPSTPIKAATLSRRSLGLAPWAIT